MLKWLSFSVGSAHPNSGLCVSWQALYQLGHLPGPSPQSVSVPHTIVNLRHNFIIQENSGIYLSCLNKTLSPRVQLMFPSPSHYLSYLLLCRLFQMLHASGIIAYLFCDQLISLYNVLWVTYAIISCPLGFPCQNAW